MSLSAGSSGLAAICTEGLAWVLPLGVDGRRQVKVLEPEPFLCVEELQHLPMVQCATGGFRSWFLASTGLVYATAVGYEPCVSCGSIIYSYQDDEIHSVSEANEMLVPGLQDIKFIKASLCVSVCVCLC